MRSATKSPGTPLNTPISFGKYDLLERINVGGMAEVFRAKAYGVEGFERIVAVKRILPNIAEDQEFIRMFIDEAKLAVQLNHANIAQIFDLGMVDGSYYIALEHVHGRDLRAIYDRCRNRRQPIPTANACFVVMKLCEGLDYAHNKRDQAGRMLGLIHRDVSPQNILVSFEGGVKIIDFGIAKAAGQGPNTQAGILKGKFGYMSPEQVRGLPIDRRSDIFSCGIVLYELLTGQRLFIGESDFATLEKVRNVEITPPTEHNSNIPDELERIVLKALSRDVDDRYQNAIDLHDELQAFVYTSGEFCSRKDLSAWMKRLFAKEIESETAKLESFRRMPARGKRSTAPPPPPGSAKPTKPQRAQVVPTNEDLDWDDDELETSIYDDEPTDAAAQIPKERTQEAHIEDIIEIEDWENQEEKTAKEVMKPKASSLAGSPAPELFKEPANTKESSAIVALTAGLDAAPQFDAPIMDPLATQSVALPTRRPGKRKKKKSALPFILLALAFAAAIAAVGVYMLNQNKKSNAGATADSGSSATSAPIALSAASSAASVAANIPKNAGFKLWITPKPQKVLMNGKPQNWPFDDSGRGIQVNRLSPGHYTLAITGPDGYASITKELELSADQLPEVKITLPPEQVRVLFSSTPAGATVTLLSGGEKTELGETPVPASLDPSKQYEVAIHKDGYKTMLKTLEFTGKADQVMDETLESLGGASTVRASRRSRTSRPSVNTITKSSRTSSREPKVDTARKKVGLVTFAVKPTCAVYVDGKYVGNTPLKEKIEVGSHRVKLVNKQFGINKTYRYNVVTGAQIFRKSFD